MQEKMGIEDRVDMHHVLPGRNELAAQQVVKETHPSRSTDVIRRHSISGHSSRYSQTNTPLPYPPEGLHNLDRYIPSFEDVPKNQVVDEIAFNDTPVLIWGTIMRFRSFHSPVMQVVPYIQLSLSSQPADTTTCFPLSLQMRAPTAHSHFL